MLEMPDDRLWSMLKVLLSGVGINMHDKKYDPKNMRKIRSLLSEITDSDIERISYLSDVYKQGGRK